MKTVALAGGVGAAKLLSGLIEVVSPEDLTVIVNTGDDFRWLGLHICPDLDTVLYTLAGLANPETGWGVRDETFRVLEQLTELGCDPWFRVGDRDLATHIYRTDLLQRGKSLTEVTKSLCERNGIRARILPMTDSPVPTQFHTDEGTLAFQDYFVRRKCTPRVLGFTHQRIEESCPAPGVLEALGATEAVLVCPSNPFVSIGPILSVPGIRAALQQIPAQVIAVSPVVAGKAVKGPTAIMMAQLQMEVSAASVAALYRDFIDIFVLDHRDQDLAPRITSLGLEVRTAPTVMDTPRAKLELARIIMGMLG